MGLSSVFSTAITGLQSSETTIDVAGNNVANSNTYGFKASKAIFSTQFLQTLSLGAAPTATNGGTNPRQVGLGTQVSSITPDFTQGTLEISASPSDLAIQGEGFFIVQARSGEQLYSRNGKFQVNSQNQLVTINGDRLLGFGVDADYQIQTTTLVPLEIPLGAAAVAKPTDNVYLEGTLTPTGDLADTPSIIESRIFSDGSKGVPPDLPSGSINPVLAPGVPASAAAGNVGGGSVPTGTYRYKIVFIDANGNESPPSIDIGPISVNNPADNAVQFTGLPVPTGDFVAKRIYRSDDVAAPFSYEFIAELPGAQLTYDDVASNPPPAPPAGVPATLNDSTLNVGNYAYFVTWFNSSTNLESRPTALVGPQAITTPGQRIRLTNIPQPPAVPAPPEYDSVRIYRSLSDTANQPSLSYLVATLPAGAGSTSYIDGATDAAIKTPTGLIDLEGPKISPGLTLDNLVMREGSTYVHVFSDGSGGFVPGVLTFAGRKGDRALAPKSLSITATTTVQDLLDFMEDAMGIQNILGSEGGSITGGGRLQMIGNNGVDNSLDIRLSGLQYQPNTGGTSQLNFQFNTTQPAKGQSAVADFIVFDSLGIPINVRVTAVLEARTGSETVYRWFADSPDNDPDSGSRISVGTGTITFDSEGKFLFASNSTVSIFRQNVPSVSPLEFALDFTQLSGLAAASSSLAATRQDGFPPGKLTSFIIGEDGVIRGIFDNGTERDLGQILLARFANPSGLQQRGQNLFAAGVNSGLPVIGNPNEQGIGSVIAGALELSNTDIGKNLIDLILASTQYRGNTRVINAAQQLLDELLNLRR